MNKKDGFLRVSVCVCVCVQNHKHTDNFNKSQHSHKDNLCMSGGGESTYVTQAGLELAILLLSLFSSFHHKQSPTHSSLGQILFLISNIV